MRSDLFQYFLKIEKESRLIIGLWFSPLANVLTIKTTGTGNCREPAGKICTIYEKGL